MLGSTPLAAAQAKPLGKFIKPTTYQSASFLVSPCSLYSGPVSDPTGNSEIFKQQDCSALESLFLPLLQPHILPKLDLQGPSLVSGPPRTHTSGKERTPRAEAFKKEENMCLHLEASSLTPSTFPHRILLPRTTSYPWESPSVPDLLVTNYRFLWKPQSE